MDVQHTLLMPRRNRSTKGAILARLIAGLGIAVRHLVAAWRLSELDFAERVTIMLIGRKYFVVGRDENSWAFIALEHGAEITRFITGD